MPVLIEKTHSNKPDCIISQISIIKINSLTILTNVHQPTSPSFKHYYTTKSVRLQSIKKTTIIHKCINIKTKKLFTLNFRYIN